jgi:hypothetical protein
MAGDGEHIHYCGAHLGDVALAMPLFRHLPDMTLVVSLGLDSPELELVAPLSLDVNLPIFV